jgi:oligoribonuclease
MQNPTLKNIKLPWLDLETTGLDEKDRVILEVGFVVTDGLLNVVDKFSSPVFQSESELAKMNDYVRNMHLSSGLLDRVFSAPALSDVEVVFIEFAKKHFGDKPLTLHGNSIHFDRRFIKQHAPTIEKALGYRMVDVSALKETLTTYSPGHEPAKKLAHRAIADIYESIAEYKSYLQLLKLLD